MSKWEYKKEVTSGGVITLDKLNELGAQGWENYDHEGNIYYFKRQVEEAKPVTLPAAEVKAQPQASPAGPVAKTKQPVPLNNKAKRK